MKTLLKYLGLGFVVTGAGIGTLVLWFVSVALTIALPIWVVASPLWPFGLLWVVVEAGLAIALGLYLNDTKQQLPRWVRLAYGGWLLWNTE